MRAKTIGEETTGDEIRRLWDRIAELEKQLAAMTEEAEDMIAKYEKDHTAMELFAEGRIKITYGYEKAEDKMGYFAYINNHAVDGCFDTKLDAILAAEKEIP